MEIPSARNSRILFRMIRKLLKKIIDPFLSFGLKKYFSKPRVFQYEGIRVKVQPEVFPPYYTHSTKILLAFIKKVNLKDKTFLELGCGSGIIALFAAFKGAIVTASDINKVALKTLDEATVFNKLNVKTIYSNLFENLKGRSFDYIVINPPYYPKNPKNIKEQAWFCGENFEYFEALFSQIPAYISDKNKTFMILSEDCDFNKISVIAKKNQLHFYVLEKRKIWLETSYIYEIVKVL